MATQKIIWTQIDEAPALASYSFLPIVEAFTNGTGIDIETSDISLSGRILAQFPERLTADQRIDDNLTRLGELTQSPDANIIKLPNISASVPQLKAAIKELQEKGYDIPDYPEKPANPEQEEIQAKYAKVLGSAVNPVLREGNSDRRAPQSVKAFARKNPHRLGEWTADNKARVASMEGGDFYGNEKSVVAREDSELTITFRRRDGQETVLKSGIGVLEGEIVDGTVMNVAALESFYRDQIEAAKNEDLLLSLHLKATMMKVSDPVLFGHGVKVFFADVFDEFGDDLDSVGVNPNLGLGDLYSKIGGLPEEKRKQIEDAITKQYESRPRLAMVDSDRGITNLHAPNDIIIDASLPVVVRDSGQMWNADGNLQQTLAMVPDRSYGPMYEAVFEDCKKHGALDPATMGSVPNVGLMAQKAEEYGSHPTTFVIPADGTVTVTDQHGAKLFDHEVHEGDIWRMSRVRDVPVRNWVELAVTRAKATGAPAVFFLDENRAHDSHVIDKVKRYISEAGGDEIEWVVKSPVDAITYCLQRIRRGEDSISVTGNVLRDYLTDLFPILELGTSAKMLSVVPLLNGGGLFETGAGGSAPKHVQQFLKENYLRWDSLGEFSALGACFEHIAQTTDNAKAKVLGETLDSAIGRFLDENKSPARKLGQIDNRGSHYYLALYWAQALAAQDDDADLKARFEPVAAALAENETKIGEELIGAQGKPVDLGGYYRPDPEKVSAAMRPSPTLNAIVDALR
ncbi:NADP-dependent isocitrate dehydrogenase [Mobilicoccus massiliensis]|uniref:NADP-dependent isocitrate dehydrogenase n=1 Tax=Mobilicoccus massiliensis TaxID=1522310 RepID=UPI00058D603D|nr:NADP-dependent isocitrate dehydrogenase [Mobilicoccus massiliensis]